MLIILHVSGRQEAAKGRGFGGNSGDDGDGRGCGRLSTLNAVVSVKARLNSDQCSWGFLYN